MRQQGSNGQLEVICHLLHCKEALSAPESSPIDSQTGACFQLVSL